jgi:hypothetical protein
MALTQVQSGMIGTANASSLLGPTLSSNVTASSLTTVGNLSSLNTAGYVGINTATPAAALHITGSATNTSSALRISDGSNNMTVGFWDNATARIESAYKPLLITAYSNPINLGIAGSTSLTVSTSGNVGVGVVSPSALFQVSGGDNTSVQSLFGQSAAWGAPSIRFQNASTNYMGIGFTSGTSTGTSNVIDAIAVQRTGYVGINNTAPSYPLDVTGTIRATTGIVFSNGSALTNSTLNDYEVGTWTPKLTTSGSSTDLAGSYSAREAHYTKVGNMVFYTLDLTASGVSGTAGTYLSVYGLPFTALSGSIYVVANMRDSGVLPVIASGNIWKPWVQSGSNYIYFQYDSLTTAGYNGTPQSWGSSGRLTLQGWYYASF